MKVGALVSQLLPAPPVTAAPPTPIRSGSVIATVVIRRRVVAGRGRIVARRRSSVARRRGTGRSGVSGTAHGARSARRDAALDDVAVLVLKRDLTPAAFATVYSDGRAGWDKGDDGVSRPGPVAQVDVGMRDRMRCAAFLRS